jgi:hypothetical protein
LSSQEISPIRLALRLAIYFAVFFGLLIATIQFRPEYVQYLPVGGTDALGNIDTDSMKEILPAGDAGRESARQLPPLNQGAAERVSYVVLFLIGHLGGTILIMIPITWTYKAIKYRTGFSRSFVHSLIILPICATTVVLLVQDSLALAFGLAALVAAVRFRVTLEEAMDGIFIFASVCVGLAAGIGYLGVAAVMGVFFCFANLVLWSMEYGQNPVDDARQQRKRAKLERNRGDQDLSP